MRDLGCSNWTLVPCEDGPWLKGRSADIFVEGQKVGQCGEIDPNVGLKFELSVPMNGAQFDLKQLEKMVRDPVH
jgi:phenylalanyl-tRNA synthetase beta subunit